MTGRSVKASALRERHAAILKKTIETVMTLTSEACISTIAVYKGELDSNWTSFNNAFNDHEDSIIGKDDLAATLEIISNEHREIYTTYLKARIKLGKLASATSPSTSAFNSTMFDHSVNSEQTKPFKLTPNRLPTFTGDPNVWVEFKATCRSVLTDKIHDVARLQLLKDALKSEPREIVQHVLPGDGSYEKAMLLLKKRYENPRNLVNSQLRRLYTIPHNEPSRENATILRTIINTINSLKAALDGCEIDTSTWDCILIFNTTQCLHAESLRAWEEKLEGTRVIPTLSQYLEFLETRITILETTQTLPIFANAPKARPPIRNNGSSHIQNRPKILFTLRSDYQCAICARNHLSSRCDELPRMLTAHERKTAVKKANACFNCLQTFHVVEQCPFDAACKKCNGKHHTLLHEEGQQVMLIQPDAPLSVEQGAEENNDNLSNVCSEFFYHVNDRNTTILATALIPIQYNVRSVVLKALVDQGSTASLITTKACQMLKLPYSHDNTPMTGVGNAPVGKVIGRANFTIGSIQNRNYKFDTNALVVKSIADISPLNQADVQNWKHLSNLNLADPSFLKSNRIDILLGAAVYAEIVLGNVVKGEPSEPIAQSTKLGWIVFGRATVNNSFVELCNTVQNQKPETVEGDLSIAIKAFWEFEEIEMPSHLKAGEIAAEESFIKNLKRSPDGKFMVELPFKVDPNAKDCLGESKTQAEKRLRSVQRRFEKNPSVKVAYDQNIGEYLTLGHMKELESHEFARCWLPHHPVLKESSSTTKVRTVFDASAKTTNGRSLNDIVHVGPTIQPELFDLLIKWRRFRYAFSGDIEKMYRQVWVDPSHALFQCILWQPPNSNEIKTYKLLTVTFGTASAPYQAIRAIDEIGRRIETKDPSLAEQIRKCFYVDDYLGTADDLQTAIKYREQVTKELAKYGFKLRKWKANVERILVDIESSEREEVVDFDTTFKTLGIAWQPSTDTFQFKSSQPKQISQWTKRKILSEIAKLYDPLGWLAPCVAKAKILMQEIWRLPGKVDWDATVPNHIVTKWLKVYEQLSLPIPIKIPRWIGMTKDANRIEIHGFCDASIRAYAAVVYIVVKHDDDIITSNLLAAKTKLAPTQTVTIPRLELCGALLLSKLLNRCLQTLAIPNGHIFTWCDSMIVLSWLAACPSRWTTFVSNRVSAIQKIVPFDHWNHVPTKQNPVDVASRGALIEELASAELWWHGPKFLRQPKLRPQNPATLFDHDIPEQKENIKVFHIVTQKKNYVLEYFSCYKRLLRFSVYAMRWYKRTRGRNSAMTANEIANAEQRWVKIVQGEMFGQDIHNIRHDGWAHVPIIRQLNPFIDGNGILRMNGRVGNADLAIKKPQSFCHPNIN